MDEAKIKEVFSDGAFVKELFEMETPAEVQAALKAKGVDMTEAEITELRDEIVKLAEKADENGELSMEALDEAAGGVVLYGGAIAGVAAITAISAIGIPTAVGVVGAGLAATGVGAVFAVQGIASAIKNRRW